MNAGEDSGLDGEREVTSFGSTKGQSLGRNKKIFVACSVFAAILIFGLFLYFNVKSRPLNADQSTVGRTSVDVKKGVAKKPGDDTVLLVEADNRSETSDAVSPERANEATGVLQRGLRGASVPVAVNGVPGAGGLGGDAAARLLKQGGANAPIPLVSDRNAPAKNGGSDREALSAVSDTPDFRSDIAKEKSVNLYRYGSDASPERPMAGGKAAGEQLLSRRAAGPVSNSSESGGGSIRSSAAQIKVGERQNSAFDAASSGGGDTSTPSARQPGRSSPTAVADSTSVEFAIGSARHIKKNPSLFVLQGTVIPCAMQTRVVSDIPSQAMCVVSENIRSADSKTVLIPKGSKVYGEYQPPDESSGRIAFFWSRLVTPNFIDIGLEAPSIDALGGGGTKAMIDRRWSQRVLGSLAVSIGIDVFNWRYAALAPTQTISKVNADGSRTSETTPLQSITVETAKAFANQELQKKLATKSLYVINQGTVGSIVTTKDLDFTSAYVDLIRSGG